MRLKGLLAAGALALFGVPESVAAELPAKPVAADYLKVCSLYGAGFYYMAGAETCIKFGGYLRAETAFATNLPYDTSRNGVAGAHNRLSNYYTSRARETLDVDTRTFTEYGVLRTFVGSTYTWTGGGYFVSGSGRTTYDGDILGGTGPGGQINGGLLGLYTAYIQFAGFTIGRAISQFSVPWVNYPGNSFDGLPGGSGTITGVNQFSYTFQLGNGMTTALSVQDPVLAFQTNLSDLSVGLSAASLIGATYGVSTFGGSRAPDIAAMFRSDQTWGLFQASVAAHDNHAAYSASGPNAGSELAGHVADKWGWAGQLGLSIKNIPTGVGDTVNMTGVYTDGATRYNFQELITTGYTMFGGTSIPGAYRSLAFGVLTDSVFVTGSSQELTTSYGLRGAFIHNWDTHWSTAMYRAWAAIRYGAEAKTWICVGPTPAARGVGSVISTGLAGCNPGFDYSVIGLITRWTPLKNLSLHADFTYAMLNQKFAAGTTFVSAGVAPLGIPAGTYELKSQGSATLLLRAQRNW